MDTSGNSLISDEEELQALFIPDDDDELNLENEDYDNPEQDLDFSSDSTRSLQDEEGYIYESIEAEVGPAADDVAEDIPPDDEEEEFYDALITSGSF